ncbi:sulfite exporter TauE/SafE family protein [candidate division KSB1 bacterium]|nr:sulfite exporter TauE/SafE family protein [candidate division KSB1 bacterium]
MRPIIPCDAHFLLCYGVPLFAVILVGMSKGGFGGAAGSLATPLLSLVFPAKFVIGFMLPILIFADWFTLYHYRWEWDWRNLRLLVPGALVGVVIGVVFIQYISDVQLKRLIGIFVLVFTVVHFINSGRGKHEHYTPRWWHGFGAGGAAGFVSAIAHSAGVIIAMFLLPQNLTKRVFVATMALFFAIANLLKVFPYLSVGLLSWTNLKQSLLFMPVVPLGIYLGLWLNKKISQKVFIQIVYVLVFITAIQLILGKNIVLLFLGR